MEPSPLLEPYARPAAVRRDELDAGLLEGLNDPLGVDGGHADRRTVMELGPADGRKAKLGGRGELLGRDVQQCPGSAELSARQLPSIKFRHVDSIRP